ncbi:MAG: hypothetical protein WBA17_02355, partial [Saprospiraceae bacterium]
DPGTFKRISVTVTSHDELIGSKTAIDKMALKENLIIPHIAVIRLLPSFVISDELAEELIKNEITGIDLYEYNGAISPFPTWEEMQNRYYGDPYIIQSPTNNTSAEK